MGGEGADDRNRFCYISKYAEARRGRLARYTSSSSLLSSTEQETCDTLPDSELSSFPSLIHSRLSLLSTNLFSSILHRSSSSESEEAELTIDEGESESRSRSIDSAR